MDSFDRAAAEFMKTTVMTLPKTRETSPKPSAGAQAKCGERNPARSISSIPVLLLEGKKKGLVSIR